jgi:hypothetical protein
MSHHHQTRLRGNVLSIVMTSLNALALACSDGDVDLGGGLVGQNLERAPRCTESTVIDDHVSVTNQGELAALAGCEEIGGNLRIQFFEGADLSPLASLRSVGNMLELGAMPPLTLEDQAGQDAFYALQEVGHIESLQGLAALESVGALTLDAVLVEDFTELASLRSIGGSLTAHRMHQLRNFAGLEGVVVSDIWISESRALESLAGLSFSEEPDAIVIEWVPALTNVDALEVIREISGPFILTGTGLSTLPELGLSATEIGLNQNNELVDMSGLRFGTVARVDVSNNPKLRSFATLDELFSIDALFVVGNDSLETLTLDFRSFLPDYQSSVARSTLDRQLELSASQFEIAYNASLREIRSPAMLSAVQYFSIYENASLTDVDFGALERADLLLIEDNPVLGSVTVPSLRTVDELQIIDNPQFSVAAFDSVLTFTRQISGNAPGAP